MLDKPKIVLIIGAGRSGSTVIGQVISHAIDGVHLGELNYLYSRSVVKDQICSCGHNFSKCTFWSTILSKHKDLIQHSQTLENTARWRFVPRILKYKLGLKSTNIREAVLALEYIYESISAEAKSDVLVDTSKNVPYALLASCSSKSFTKIILMRNVISFIKSTRKQKFIPEINMVGRLHPKSRLFYFFEWCLIYVTCVYFLKSRNAYFTTYTNFINNHQKLLRKIFPGINPINYCQTVTFLSEQHDLGGNPSRFKRKLKLRKE